MNIFEIYLEKIKKILIKLGKENSLIIPAEMDNINVELPPVKFK